MFYTSRWGSGFKLEEGRFKLDVWKKFLTQNVVRHWQSLPKEAVDAPSLEFVKDKGGCGPKEPGLVENPSLCEWGWN